MTRRQILAVVASLCLLTSAVAPAAALSVGPLGGDSNPSLSQVEYGADANPSFVVELENSSTSASALQKWASAGDDRRLIALDNDSKTATIAAPSWRVQAGTLAQLQAAVRTQSVDALTASQLASEGYIESIHPNYQHDVEPMSSLMRADAFEAPDLGPIDSLRTPGFATDGLAFAEDANETTPDEVRATLDSDAVSGTGEGITIGVVDSGTNTADGRVFGNGTAGSEIRISNASKSFISNETVNESGWDAIEDQNGHGTWVSSALAANASGTQFDASAPDANLLVLKALNAEGSGSTSDIAAAIRYAADHDVDVLGLSLGSPISDAAISDAINYAHANGVQAITVAAGNSRMTLAPGLGSPADMDSVISVGATNGSTSLNHSASAYFSQVSGAQAIDGNLSLAEEVDVVAPGMKTMVKAPSTDGFVSNSTLSGTSMAQPNTLSAMVAAMSANQTLAEMNHEELHDAVTASAEPVPQMAEVEAGHGMFNTANLATGSHPEQSQIDAMNSGAQQRQVIYETMAARNGFLARIADSVGV